MILVTATVTKVYDGDTFTCDVDLAFGLLALKRRVRVARINAPELDEPGGTASRSYASGLLLSSLTVTLQCLGLDKYGRELAHVLLADGRDLASAMVAKRHAKWHDYGAQLRELEVDEPRLVGAGGREPLWEQNENEVRRALHAGATRGLR